MHKEHCDHSRHFIDNSHERPSILRAVNVWFHYQDQEDLLQGVNLEVRQGLVTMVLGRSGSGKTTLLKLLGNILNSEKGKIEWLGGSAQSRNSLNIAYIPQSLGLVRNMSVLDNTLIGALGYTPTVFSMLHQFSRNAVNEAQDILKSLGIWDKHDRKVCTLSGGERQRVAIARALMLNPKLILADEFVSQLDPITTTEILDMMRDLTQKGISFLVTTHDIEIVKKYADRVVIMKEGRILCDHAVDSMVVDEMLECIK